MKPRVLLVDDDSSVRKVLSLLLRNEGFEVQTCAGGRQALACLRAGTYDMLVTDYEMPEGDGIELVRAVREEAAGLRTFIVSGRSAPEDAPEGVPWMSKPVSIEGLVAALRA